MSETTPETTETEEAQVVTTAEEEPTAEPTAKADDTIVKPDNYHTP